MLLDTNKIRLRTIFWWKRKQSRNYVAKDVACLFSTCFTV